MSDWWGTRAETDEWGGVKPGTGLAGFFSHPDTGAEISDRLGGISQILMNLGSGRGGTDLGGISERSEFRRERRKQLTMAMRMADKLQATNPELADMIRANPQMGMELAGKQALMPMEFEQQEKLTKMRADAEYDKAVALAEREAELAREDTRLRLAAMGIKLDPYGGGETAPASDVPSDAIVPNNPATQSLGTGEQEIQVTPLSEASQVPASTPPPEAVGGESEPLPPSTGDDGIDWTVGLTDLPGFREAHLQQRKLHNDPEMPFEDFQLLLSAGLSKTGGTENYNKALTNIARRKEVRQRTAEFAAREKAFNVAPQGPSLPTDKDMPAPGASALLQAGIDPSFVPPEQVAQKAEVLRQAYPVGAKEYNDALSRLLPSQAGLNIEFDPVTGKPTSITQGGSGSKKGDTQEQARLAGLAMRTHPSLAILERPEVRKAMSTGWEPWTMNLPDAVANRMVGDDFQIGRVAGLNFLSAILRKESMSAVTEGEQILYGRLFLPASSDSEKTLNFKEKLREKAYLGMKAGMSEAGLTQLAVEEKEKFERTGELPVIEASTQEGAKEAPKEEKTIPPMSKKAKARGLTEYQWNNISDAAREALGD